MSYGIKTRVAPASDAVLTHTTGPATLGEAQLPEKQTVRDWAEEICECISDCDLKGAELHAFVYAILCDFSRSKIVASKKEHDAASVELELVLSKGSDAG